MVDFLLTTINNQVLIFRRAISRKSKVFFFNKSSTQILLRFASEGIFGKIIIPVPTDPKGISLTVSDHAFGDYTFEVFDSFPSEGTKPVANSQIAVTTNQVEGDLYFSYELIGQSYGLSLGAKIKRGENVNFITDPKGSVLVDFPEGNPLQDSTGEKLPDEFDVNDESFTKVDENAETGTHSFRARVDSHLQANQSGGTLQGDLILDPPN